MTSPLVSICFETVNQKPHLQQCAAKCYQCYVKNTTCRMCMCITFRVYILLSLCVHFGKAEYHQKLCNMYIC